MSKKKKIIIAVISVLVVIALIAGGIRGYMAYQNNNLTAEVQTVENLKWYYWGDETSSYGMVTNDFYQDVFLIDGQSVEEVYVEEGQEVKAGDSLMAYDMTLTNLDIEMQVLEIETISNNITLAKRELEKLRNTTPIPDTPEPQPEPEPEPDPPEEPEVPQIEEMKKDAYNYISATAKYYKGEGTLEEPYRYLCTPECYVEGAFLNVLADSEEAVFVVFEIREKNRKKGKLIASWSVSSVSLMRVDEDSRWSVMNRQEVVDPEPEDPGISYEDEYEDEFEDEPVVTGYTAAELKSEIQKTERELRNLDLDKRKAEMELDQMKKLSDKGIVTAEIDGIVKTVGNKEKLPTDGSAFLTISGSEGLYVTGSLSELMLGDVQVGQTVYANSWESGMNFEATIMEISEYPSESSNSYGEGNPNVSYYPYTAYIADSEGLKNGEYVELKMNANSGEGQEAEGLYIMKAYVREENGRYYVLKEGEDGRLVKQYIETGKTIYGQAIEIKAGLTTADRIAFPYGKTAKEGVKVKESSDTVGMYY